MTGNFRGTHTEQRKDYNCWNLVWPVIHSNDIGMASKCLQKCTQMLSICTMLHLDTLFSSVMLLNCHVSFAYTHSDEHQSMDIQFFHYWKFSTGS